jgi:hypothetical protein
MRLFHPPGVKKIMNAMRKKRFRLSGASGWDAKRVCAVAALAFILVSVGWTQQQGSGGAMPRASVGVHDPDPPAMSPQMEEQLTDRRNVERQKQLEADTEKLYTLAQQLRDEVAKTNKDQLSVLVVKKSEEIEKLAKSVKEKMRGY